MDKKVERSAPHLSNNLRKKRNIKRHEEISQIEIFNPNL